MFMFDFMPFIISLMILIYVIIYLMMDDDEGYLDDEEDSFIKRTDESYDRVFDSGEEFSVDEFLERIRKW